MENYQPTISVSNLIDIKRLSSSDALHKYYEALDSLLNSDFIVLACDMSKPVTMPDPGVYLCDLNSFYDNRLFSDISDTQLEKLTNTAMGGRGDSWAESDYTGTTGPEYVICPNEYLSMLFKQRDYLKRLFTLNDVFDEACSLMGGKPYTVNNCGDDDESDADDCEDSDDI